MPTHEDRGLFNWAACFVASRQFGWGVPYTNLSPLVDMANHADWSQTTVDVFHSKLHLADNKIYNYRTNFQRNFELDEQITDDEKFDKSFTRLQYDVRRFYEQRGGGEAHQDVTMGRKAPTDAMDLYDDKEVF